MSKRPLQYAVYKGVGGKFGALQFNFQSPHYYKGTVKDFTGKTALDQDGRLLEGWRQREGAVFVEAASAIGKNQYDWENKITFACSVSDMGKVSLSLTTSAALDIMHDPGAKTENEGAVRKHLKLLFAEKVTTKGCIAIVSEQKGDDKKEHKIPLSADECIALRQLYLTAIPKALAW